MIILILSYIAIGVAVYLYCRLFRINPLDHIPSRKEVINILKTLVMVLLPSVLLAPLFWYFFIREVEDNGIKVAEEIVCYDLTDVDGQTQIK